MISNGDIVMMAGCGLPETVGVPQQLGGRHGGGVQVARHQGDQHRVCKQVCKWLKICPQRCRQSLATYEVEMLLAACLGLHGQATRYPPRVDKDHSAFFPELKNIHFVPLHKPIKPFEFRNP